MTGAGKDKNDETSEDLQQNHDNVENTTEGTTEEVAIVDLPYWIDNKTDWGTETVAADYLYALEFTYTFAISMMEI